MMWNVTRVRRDADGDWAITYVDALGTEEQTLELAYEMAREHVGAFVFVRSV